VFRWRFAPRFTELGVDEEGFLRFVRQMFAQKRKTLANNLRAAGYRPEAIQIALTGTSIQSQARAEALSIEELARLFINLEKERTASSSEAATPVKQ
jgi:16S rRNA (adenine1518-N6/adenine1519-N6)-dimethyltransferase